jgi:hypothetical protein
MRCDFSGVQIGKIVRHTYLLQVAHVFGFSDPELKHLHHPPALWEAFVSGLVEVDYVPT